MVDTFRIKRRAVGGAAGPPSALKNAELAFNEQDDTLYYGKGDSGGNATSIIAVGGPGAFQPLATSTFRATLSADVTGIPQNAFTKINFNTAGINIGGHYNTSTYRWTPPAGRIMLGLTYYGNVGASANLYAAIYKNGASIAYVFNNSGPNTITYASCQWIDVANGTDYYEAYVLQNGPAGAIVYASSAQTFFYGARF